MSSPHLRPHPSRCDPARSDYGEILKAHEDAVAEGESWYRDPSSGLLVLTAVAHITRGACCDSGCRHCPYLTD
jgi:hypothetical protein